MAKRSSRSRGPTAAGIAPFGGLEIQPAWVVSGRDEELLVTGDSATPDTIEREREQRFFLVSIGTGSVVAKV